MATPNPWAGVPRPTGAKSETSFPGLKNAETGKGAKSMYEEVQADELIALSSIYADDFKSLDRGGGAWKKSNHAFQVTIKSSDEDFIVVLHVTFVASYPRSPPILQLFGQDQLRDTTRHQLDRIMDTKPKELAAAEQPMVMELVEALRDILEGAAATKKAGRELPSLEEERAKHELEAAKIARQLEEEQKKKKQVENEEEERILQDMVQDELKRQKAKVREAKRKSKPPTLGRELTLEEGADNNRERLLFDQPIVTMDVDGSSTLFQAVTEKTLVRKGRVSSCYSVKPVVKGVTPCVLALKQVELSSLIKDNTHFKSSLRSLESELEALKKIRHDNILDVLGYKVVKIVEHEEDMETSWTISILTEYAEKGSLEEFLDIAECLGVEKVRAWTIELLDALRYLHDHGVIHKDLHAGNIMLVRSSSGAVTAKIADAGYQRHLHELNGTQAGSTSHVSRSAYWSPPENANIGKPQYTQKTDVWDLGIIFLQMTFGIHLFQKYASPDRLVEAVELSEPLEEIIRKFFKNDPKKRPRSFELSSSEFLATDAPILSQDRSLYNSRMESSSSIAPQTPRRLRRESSHAVSSSFSRWKLDFTEVSRLGKGGFGEVVKARKKLDGHFYAIKTIVQKSSSSLTEILKEVRLLSQLNHPYVVRYYNTWTEEISGSSETDDDTASTFEESGNAISTHDIEPDVGFATSTGGLDFISSSGYPQIEFGYNSDEEPSTESDDEVLTEDDESDAISNNNDGSPLYERNNEDNHNLDLKRTRSSTKFQRSTRTILYIQMEYCEKRTLRDLIKRGLYKEEDEIWRLFRQTLEGMAHIHGLNIVHRDLKPENIFIDGASNVRIGDFGLATAGQYAAVERAATGQASHSMTTSIGTASYVAPEVRSAVGTYNSKVDMYSLGIIFFEMCYPPVIGMERAQVLQHLRQPQPTLPQDFNLSERSTQADIVLSLVDHNSKERPSSVGLLQSGKLPVQMENETIRQTIAGLSDPKSPYYQSIMGALFSRANTQARDFAWDMETSMPTARDFLLRNIVKQQLTSIFRKHGALETPRPMLFPRSIHYDSSAVQLLDLSGTLVQMPYDLTLPHARSVAKHAPTCLRTYTFGKVFRDRAGGQPTSVGEVDFDIVSDSLDLALREAEVIKVLDEVVAAFPSLKANQMCFHINHSDLLENIFDFCRIEASTRPAVVEVLSKLNIQQWTWQKIKSELRSPLIGVSAVSVDDLQRFDFRDNPQKTFSRLKAIFEGTDTFDKAAPSMAHLTEVVDYLKKFEIQSKVYVNPLSSLKQKFYKGGILFSSLYDSKHKDVFAAGGRYDSLVREYQPKMSSTLEDRHAVGFSLAWEKLSMSMARFQKAGNKSFLKRPDQDATGIWTTRRCDVLVASFDATILRSSGVEILQTLWANDISAELAADSRSPEELLAKYRDEQHCWIVIIKQDTILKIKTMGRNEVPDVDIPATQLLSWFRGEIRERDQREGVHERAKLVRHASQPDTNGASEHEQEVRVLIAQTRSKKSNRKNIVEHAQARAGTLVQSFLDGPIAAIETTDQVMDMIGKTRLSDPDSWRNVSQSVPTTERRYIGEIHDLMKGLAYQNKSKTSNAFVYNFRTGSCIYYDMEA